MGAAVVRVPVCMYPNAHADRTVNRGLVSSVGSLPVTSCQRVQQDDSGADSGSGSEDGSSMDADGSAAKPGKPQRAAKKVRTVS